MEALRTCVRSLNCFPMRYTEFRDLIQSELRRHPAGLTWVELKTRLRLPYDRPCPTWTRQLEEEIGLRRVPGKGRAKVWGVDTGRSGLSR